MQVGEEDEVVEWEWAEGEEEGEEGMKTRMIGNRTVKVRGMREEEPQTAPMSNAIRFIRMCLRDCNFDFDVENDMGTIEIENCWVKLLQQTIWYITYNTHAHILYLD